MSKVYYYVVAVSVSDRGFTDWDLDPYTEDARFPDGTVWDEETEEWEHHDSESNSAKSEELTKSLLEALTHLGRI